MRPGDGHQPTREIEVQARATALIVDDEPDLRFLLRRLLGRHGWEIIGEAADGVQAMELAARLQPTVVLLDLHMDTPGHEVLPRVLRIAPASMVAVVSNGDPRVHRRLLLDLGAFSLYEKTDLEQLPGRLERDLARFHEVLGGNETVPSWMRDGQPARI